MRRSPMKFELCKGVRLGLVLASAGCASAALASGPEPRPVSDRDAVNVQVIAPGQKLGPIPRGEPEILCTLNEADSCQILEFPRVAATSFGSMGVGGLSLNV